MSTSSRDLDFPRSDLDLTFVRAHTFFSHDRSGRSCRVPRTSLFRSVGSRRRLSVRQAEPLPYLPLLSSTVQITRMTGFATSILSIGSLVHSIFLTWTHQAKGQTEIDVGVSRSATIHLARPPPTSSLTPFALSVSPLYSMLTWTGLSPSFPLSPLRSQRR